MFKNCGLRCGLMLAQWIARLPLSWMLKVGQLIGSLAYWVASSRRRIAEKNIALCFPHLDLKAQKLRVKAHFQAAGMGIVETLYAWWATDAALRDLFEIQGAEHLAAAQATGQGIILLTAHFTCLELGARAITRLSPFHAMYRPHKNPLFEARMRTMRELRSQRTVIPRDDVRGVLRALKKGEAVWYAPDQNYGGVDHVFAPFFGVPALTITATAKLAKAGHAVVLPYFCKRIAGRYHVHILPMLSDFPSDLRDQDAVRLNQLFESWIEQAPEQYLWVHRRFKSRPKGEPWLY